MTQKLILTATLLFTFSFSFLGASQNTDPKQINTELHSINSSNNSISSEESFLECWEHIIFPLATGLVAFLLSKYVMKHSSPSGFAVNSACTSAIMHQYHTRTNKKNMQNIQRENQKIDQARHEELMKMQQEQFEKFMERL